MATLESEPLTVKEVMEELKKYPQDAPVFVADDGGYCSKVTKVELEDDVAYIIMWASL